MTAKTPSVVDEEGFQLALARQESPRLGEAAQPGPAQRRLIEDTRAHGAKRVAAGVFRTTIRRMDAFAFGSVDVLFLDSARFASGSGPSASSPTAYGGSVPEFFGTEDLMVPITAAFGSRDMFAQGKYRRASIFAFETPNLYVWAVIEPGARGTSWRLARKDGEVHSKPVGFCHHLRIGQDPSVLTEVGDLFEKILAGAALAHEPTRSGLSPLVPAIARIEGALNAAKEADEIALGTREPEASPKTRSIKL